MISIRSAVEDDIDVIRSFDLIAQGENERQDFISRAVVSGECFVAVTAGKVIGYAVFNYNFYHNGCVEMLFVHTDHRRIGAGVALLRHVESLCHTPKLFVSTNLSNFSMQSLLAKLNYVLSGVVHNLDEADPEIIFFKRVR